MTFFGGRAKSAANFFSLLTDSFKYLVHSKKMYDKTIFQNNLLKKKFESIVTVMNCFCTEYFQIFLVKLCFYFSEMLFFLIFLV